MEALPEFQCYGSVTFWCGIGSGFADSYLRLTDSESDLDPAPDPAIFVVVEIIEFNEWIYFLALFENLFYLFCQDP